MEALILDPAEVAQDRTEFDLLPYVSQAGIDWGTAELQAYMAEQARGSSPVDVRFPNRVITVPLVVKDRGEGQFAQVRSAIQAKVARFQQEGGWLKRVTGTAAVYVDIVNATLKFNDSWLAVHKEVDPEAELTLECLPDFYSDEEELDLHSGSGALVFLEGPAPEFDGMIGWYRRETLANADDGEPVSEWVDSSGSGHDLVVPTYADTIQRGGAGRPFRPSLYLRLQETSGTVAFDSAISPHNGTYVNTPTLGVDGPLFEEDSKAVTLNGTDEYITVLDDAAFDFGDSFGFSTALKTTDADGFLLSAGANAIAVKLVGGTVELWKQEVNRVAHSSTTINNGQWHNLVCTKSGTTRKIFIDGVDVTVLDTNATVANTSANIHLGRWSGGATEFLAATIAEAALYPYEVSEKMAGGHYLAMGDRRPKKVENAETPKVTLVSPFAQTESQVNAFARFQGETWLAIVDVINEVNVNEIWRVTDEGETTLVETLGVGKRAWLVEHNGELWGLYAGPTNAAARWVKWNGNEFEDMGAVAGAPTDATAREWGGLFSNNDRILAVHIYVDLFYRTDAGVEGQESGTSRNGSVNGGIDSLKRFGDDLFAATSQPSRVRKRPWTGGAWTNVMAGATPFAKSTLGVLSAESSASGEEELYLFGSAFESAGAMAGVHRWNGASFDQLYGGGNEDFNFHLYWGAIEFGGHLHVGDRRGGRLRRLDLNEDGSFRRLLDATVVGGEDVYPGPVVNKGGQDVLQLGTFGKFSAPFLAPGLYEYRMHTLDAGPYDGLRFDGVRNIMHKQFAQVQPVEVVVIARYRCTNETSYNPWNEESTTLIDGDRGGPDAFEAMSIGNWPNDIRRFRAYAGGSDSLDVQEDVVPMEDDEPTIDNEPLDYFHAFYSGNSSFLEVNDARDDGGGGIPGTTSPGGITLGNGLEAANAASVDVFELILYNRALTATERDKLRGYAYERYGVGSAVLANSGIRGDYPGRLRLAVTDGSGNDRRGLIGALRSKHYSPASTARLVYDAEDLTLLDAATITGGDVRHGAVGTGWTPMFSTQIAGVGHMTHTGSYRVFARWLPPTTAPTWRRLVWDVGDLALPVENGQWASPTAASGNYYIADLGTVRLDTTTGTHRWQGAVQARGTSGGEAVRVQRLWFVPLDEGFVKLTAPVSFAVGLAGYVDRDEFNQSAGNLTGKTSAAGLTWAGAGDAVDLAVEATGHTVTRAEFGDADEYTGRYAISGATALAAQVVQVDTKQNIMIGTQHLGVLARYTDTSNWLRASIATSTPGTARFRVKKRVAGSVTTLLDVQIPSWTSGVWYSIRLMADAQGRWSVWWWPQAGAIGSPLASGVDAALATGGALASGKPGFYDADPTGGVATRSYNNFAAWVPERDAVLFASRQAELRWDRHVRQDTSGVAFGPVSDVQGDLLRLPPSGIEVRPVEVLALPTRGDFGELEDTGGGTDAVSGQVFYRPSWLFPPGS